VPRSTANAIESSGVAALVGSVRLNERVCRALIDLNVWLWRVAPPSQFGRRCTPGMSLALRTAHLASQAPKGRSNFSPGQRPGKRRPNVTKPERASQCQTAIAACISAPFQGFDSFCDANPGRCPGLKLGRAVGPGNIRSTLASNNADVRNRSDLRPAAPYPRHLATSAK